MLHACSMHTAYMFSARSMHISAHSGHALSACTVCTLTESSHCMNDLCAHSACSFCTNCAHCLCMLHVCPLAQSMHALFAHCVRALHASSAHTHSADCAWAPSVPARCTLPLHTQCTCVCVPHAPHTLPHSQGLPATPQHPLRGGRVQLQLRSIPN